MTRFLRNPSEAVQDDGKLVSQLIYGWGNEAWASSTEYAIACLEEATKCSGPILECGSGLTTILVGALTDQSNKALYSLESSREWRERVGTVLRKFKIDSVQLLDSPITEYAGFDWYQIPDGPSFPRSFDLVICDGPPSVTRGGRYGMLPVMRNRLRNECVVLLDDANRQEELEIAERWASESGGTFERCHQELERSHVRMVLA